MLRKEAEVVLSRKGRRESMGRLHIGPGEETVNDPRKKKKGSGGIFSTSKLEGLRLKEMEIIGGKRKAINVFWPTKQRNYYKGTFRSEPLQAPPLTNEYLQIGPCMTYR